MWSVSPQLNEAVRQLPRVRLSVSVEGWWEAAAAAERRPIACRQQPAQPTRLDLHADQDYTLQVELRRLNPPVNAKVCTLSPANTPGQTAS